MSDKFFKRKEKIDVKKRKFLKTGILGLLAGISIGVLSKIPFASAWSISSKKELKDYKESVQAMAAHDVDLELGNVQTYTLSGSQTLTFSNPPASGKAGSFTLIVTNGGSATLTWPASVDWAGGTAPTLTSSGVDVLVFVTTDGGTTWLGFSSGLDMK